MVFMEYVLGVTCSTIIIVLNFDNPVDFQPWLICLSVTFLIQLFGKFFAKIIFLIIKDKQGKQPQTPEQGEQQQTCCTFYFFKLLFGALCVLGFLLAVAALLIATRAEPWFASKPKLIRQLLLSS